MICIYCGGKTQVVNSRHQVKANSVWRRRKCTSCGSIFSSVEAADLARSISVESGTHLEPFSRDKLLMSIFSACGHRKDAVESSTALTDTIISKLLGKESSPVVHRDEIALKAFETLKRFDKPASVHYKAYHLKKVDVK